MQYDFFTRTFEPVEEDKDSGKEETEVKQPEGEGEAIPAGETEGDVEEGGVKARREEEQKEVGCLGFFSQLLIFCDVIYYCVVKCSYF